ncbi:MAG: hypothetical protein OEX03_09280 [Gammaproteobacteria bacterium]|nr:hypothetical protein [Gammaproteobacteria bacterium]
MSRKWIVSLIIISLLIFLLWPNQERVRESSVAMMPWDIEFSSTGKSRVMGLEIGTSTPADASEMFARRGELALFADEGGTLSAESFFSELTTGGLSGRIILNLDLDKAELEKMAKQAVKRKTMETGSIKYTPSREDRLSLLTLPIVSITYIPYIDLDMNIIESRFGKPDQIVTSVTGQKHLLYPLRGMEIILDDDGKEVIQYVNRDEFSRIEKALNERNTNPQE